MIGFMFSAIFDNEGHFCAFIGVTEDFPVLGVDALSLVRNSC